MIVAAIGVFRVTRGVVPEVFLGHIGQEGIYYQASTRTDGGYDKFIDEGWYSRPEVQARRPSRRG